MEQLRADVSGGARGPFLAVAPEGYPRAVDERIREETVSNRICFVVRRLLVLLPQVHPGLVFRLQFQVRLGLLDVVRGGVRRAPQSLADEVPGLLGAAAALLRHGPAPVGFLARAPLGVPRSVLVARGQVAFARGAHALVLVIETGPRGFE